MAAQVTESGFRRASVVTPHDSNNHAFSFKALYVGGTGTLTVVTEAGDVCLFSAIPVGTILPVSGTRVNATGTTATLIVAMA